MGKVIGLHFGLNKLGFKPPKPVDELRYAENDALAYHQICADLGWSSKYFLGSNATLSTFLEEIIKLSHNSVKDDLVVITFSGHGTRVEDINLDEKDEYDEILVFYDRLLLDDLVKVQFSRFKRGVNILFITDCCHSGTISRLFGEEEKDEEEFITRGFDAETGQLIFDANPEYKIMKQSINERAVNIEASIIHLAACQDDETAYDGSVIMKHGLLTHRLLKTWDKGSFSGTYSDFFLHIESQMGGNQNPKLNFEGVVNDSFIQSKPFNQIIS
ncbi:caspase family protein [Aquimarina rubra]|uniref:Caspase family protein n=1 Tax=Aquimarina rubra TaxID=1920033 RepID=A0ABW5LDI5_9FLAO